MQERFLGGRSTLVISRGARAHREFSAGMSAGLGTAPSYWTNSLYSTWDNQLYPDGVPGVEVMANASASGGLELAKDYWVSFPDGYRAHQIRLEGGDCSTDSFCYPSV